MKRTPSMYPRREPIGRWDWVDRLGARSETGARFSTPSDTRATYPSSAPRLSIPSLEPRLPSSAPRLSIPATPRRSSVPSSEARILARSSAPPDGNPRASERSRAARKELPFARWLPGKPPVEPAVVSISIGVQMDALRYTHAFLDAYLRRRFSPSMAEPLSIASCELLDNALSYGSVSEPVLVELIESPTLAAVRVTNSSIPARVDVLVAQIERLAGPGPVFFEEIKRGLAREMARPMLGLARILHEATLDLELFVDEQRVCMCARRGK